MERLPCAGCHEGEYVHGCSKNSTGTCLPCPHDCGSGAFRTGCGKDPGGQALGTCVSCTGLPSQASYLATGGLHDSCPWQCKAGLYWFEGACLPCDTSSCLLGEYLDDCGKTSAGICKPCTGRPLFSRWIASGGFNSDTCDWECLIQVHSQQDDSCIVSLGVLLSLVLAFVVIAALVWMCWRKWGCSLTAKKLHAQPGWSAPARTAHTEFESYSTVHMQNVSGDVEVDSGTALLLQDGNADVHSRPPSSVIPKTPHPRAARAARDPVFWQHHGDEVEPEDTPDPSAHDD
eukprot:gnl/MRDRNA2_/MRDRNA2_103980_c0_seq1.p1 gnl/MRDRNA2_/MRDRNA2_103980_c0~~gnl/MRDRNA2_/MRDRNA2_103980_c0_seq1.p1  ORF type:complete len:289 (+),score=47.56 gnl/MRDRNA2_/MRDRNA2_103980_c0_seq1:78-944(+)